MRKLHGTYSEGVAGGSYRTQDEKPGSIGGAVVEADPSVKPPEKWFKMMSNDVKKKNPSYSDDQVQKTIGDIWYHKLTTAKKKEIRGREGKHFGHAESVEEAENKKLSDFKDAVKKEWESEGNVKIGKNDKFKKEGKYLWAHYWEDGQILRRDLYFFDEHGLSLHAAEQRYGEGDKWVNVNMGESVIEAAEKILGKDKMIQMAKELEFDINAALDEKGIKPADGKEIKVIASDYSEPYVGEAKKYKYPEMMGIKIVSGSNIFLTLRGDGKFIPEGKILSGKGLSKEEVIEMVCDDVAEWGSRAMKADKKGESVNESYKFTEKEEEFVLNHPAYTTVTKMNASEKSVFVQDALHFGFKELADNVEKMSVEEFEDFLVNEVGALDESALKTPRKIIRTQPIKYAGVNDVILIKHPEGYTISKRTGHGLIDVDGAKELIDAEEKFHKLVKELSPKDESVNEMAKGDEPLSNGDVVKVITGKKYGRNKADTGVVNRIDGDSVNVFLKDQYIGTWFNKNELKRIGSTNKKTEGQDITKVAGQGCKNYDDSTDQCLDEKKEKWVIRDWAGNYPFEKNPHQGAVKLGGKSVNTFDSEEEAEEFLSNHLGDKYDAERGEYEIMKESVGNIKGQDLHKKIKHNGVEYDVSIEKEMNGYNAVVKHDGDIMLDKVFKTYNEAEEAIMLMLDKYQISSVTEDKNPIADYEVTVEIPVEQAAEMVSKKGDLKKALDLDYMELGGYDVDPTKYNLPKGFDGADVYFKNAVKQAIYSADEFAALSAYHKAAIDAVVERFEKVEPTTMEYAGDTSKGEQSFVSAVAGVTSAHYDKDSGKVVVTIKNPHHLINGIISGVGFFGVDLPIDEKIDEKETMDRLHNIIDYYDVWGERIPEIDERATENASWDDDMFKEELIFRIGETTEADLIEDLLEIPKDEEIDMDQIMKIKGNPFEKKDLEKIINKIERIRAKHKEADDIKYEAKQLKEDDIGDDPAVYVGTYGKYTGGSIDGAWVSLNKYPTKDEFYEYIKELHKDEEDPEFMFQDYQNFPEKYYSESGLDDGIWDWLALDEDDREMLEAYIEATGDDKVSIDDAKDKFQGKYDSKEDWAQEFIDQSGGLGDSAHYYLSISDLDARLIAQDEATSLAENMRYSLKKEDYEEVFDRTDKFKEEYEALKEKMESEEDEDKVDEIKSEIEKLAEKSIEEWESEYSDEVEEKIKDDVVGYFVDEQGSYSLEDLAKQPFISIDYEKYVRDTEMNGDVNFVKHNGEYWVFWGH